MKFNIYKIGAALKVLIVLFVVVASVVSCQKEEPMPQGNYPVKLITKAVPINSLTKTVLNNDMSISWESNDKLAIISETSSGSGTLATLSLIEGANSGTATFEGTVASPEIPAKCYFTYPVETNSEINTSEGTITFSYDGQSGKHNPYLVSSAVTYNSSGITATLNHIGGVLKVGLPSGIENIIVQGNNGEALSGYKYNYESGSGEIVSGAATQFSVAAGGAAGTYYINMPPVKFEKGFTLIFEGPDGAKMYKSFNYGTSGGCDFSQAPASGQAVTATTLKGALVEVVVSDFVPYGLTSTAVASHTYNEGTLTGSQVQISGVTLSGAPNSLVTSYTAKLTNGNGAEVRNYSSSSVPASFTMNVANNWPYLPQGNYTLTQTVTTIYGTTTESSTVTVGAPTLTATVDAKTSYSYYLEGKINENNDGVINMANECDNATIYGITVGVKISNAILGNTNYSSILPNAQYKIDSGNYSTAKGMAASSSTVNLGNIGGQSWASHTVTGKVTFDGASATASKSVQITGLPYVANPPREGEWSVDGSGLPPVLWENNHAHLSNGAGEVSIISKSFYIPENINISVGAKYSVMGKTIGTTCRIFIGTQEVFKTSVGDWYKEETVESSKPSQFTDSNNYIKCHNSYGGGATHSRIYYVKVYYR